MPIPTGFDNSVLLAESASEIHINTLLDDRNTAGYWCTSMEIQDNDTALLLFVKSDYATAGYSAAQKVNAVNIDQGDLDTDKATEATAGYWPTGIFLNPDNPGTVFVLYSLLNPVA